uniref:Uncharacterized protein n=1 Tax=Anopheles culicifacies TaxID=139723 RepID=A0A182MCD0_9DIPT
MILIGAHNPSNVERIRLSIVIYPAFPKPGRFVRQTTRIRTQPVKITRRSGRIRNISCDVVLIFRHLGTKVRRHFAPCISRLPSVLPTFITIGTRIIGSHIRDECSRIDQEYRVGLLDRSARLVPLELWMEIPFRIVQQCKALANFKQFLTHVLIYHIVSAVAGCKFTEEQIVCGHHIGECIVRHVRMILVGSHCSTDFVQIGSIVVYYSAQPKQ